MSLNIYFEGQNTLPYLPIERDVEALFLSVHLDGGELNRGALAEIAKHCTRGALLLPAKNYYIQCKLDDNEIDVICWGTHYTSLHAFSEYMMEEAPYDPAEP